MSESEPKKKRRRRRRSSGKSKPAGAPAGPAPESSASAPDGAAPRRRRGRRGGRRRRGGEGRGGAETGPPTLDAARRTARSRFGITRLRPEQLRAMEAILSDRDALVILPTGAGKSLIYQVPAVLSPRPTLVISPLIALMRDQEISLRKRGVPVVRLDSTLRVAERREALARIAKGGSLVVLTTPETLESKDARPAFEAAQPGLLCVDEAHCVTEWGHDFRPSYLRLGAERAALGIPRALALTATATPRVQEDIVKRLRLDDPEIVLAPAHRTNLRLEAKIATGRDKITQAGDLLRRLPRPGIVYCATKRDVDTIHLVLGKARIGNARYHGGMTTAERDSEMRRFMKRGNRTIMVATSAFGMGIDKPDIRFILHYHAPASPEQYVQEAGRAGRDGKRSRCILLYDPSDLDIQRFLQDKSRPGPAQLRRVAKALEAWAAEDRAVEPRDLALAASVPITTCRSLCAQLEEAGLVVRERGQGFRSVVELDALREGSRDLAKRFEVERRQDEHRLLAMQEYVMTEDCRSVFLRRWFGEDDPPACGTCDRCREEEPPASPPARSGRARGRKPKEQPRGRRGGRRGKRGGRGRRKTSGGRSGGS